ncbi:hypothetical protein Cni_G07595 [Canna indica]|uniref:Transmembrane protein n=1 Tax=Canna indica TaxID=4628 RepID=A0AAQ3JZ05_9LILI|nr:hypothetical protein Cni_G07595 [Canna indica]
MKPMSTDKIKSRRQRKKQIISLSCFATCFSSSLVSVDPNLYSKPSVGAVDSKRKLSSCFSWSSPFPMRRSNNNNNKKKKKKKGMLILNSTPSSIDHNTTNASTHPESSPVEQVCNGGNQNNVNRQQEDQAKPKSDDATVSGQIVSPRESGVRREQAAAAPPDNQNPTQTAGTNTASRPPRRSSRPGNRRCPSGQRPPILMRPSAVGLWVAAGTLGVMVFSGRAVAIVCLSCCLYLLPL